MEINKVVEKQYRALDVEEKDNKRIIFGYGIVFNSLSENLGGFHEMILPEAVTVELINKSDIYFLWNHKDTSYPLARSKCGVGSLKLSIDEIGLRYEFECLNEEYFNLVKRGDISNASFAFNLPVDKSGEIWEKSKEYNYILKIKKIDELFDVSSVLRPAYSSASTNARSLTPPVDDEEEVKPTEPVKPIKEEVKPESEQPTQEPQPEKPVEEPQPEQVKEEEKPIEEEPVKEEKEIDYSTYDNIINSLKK